MSSTLRVGLVGAGFIARFQLAAMKQVRGMEVAGVTALKGGPALARLAHKMGFGEPAVYKSISEMANHVDCIAIFCPNFTRISVVEEIVASVKAGAHLKGVICEKPLGRTVAEARRLIELAASVKLCTAYFENQLFMKAVQTQRRQLEPVLPDTLRRGTCRAARALVLGSHPAGRRGSLRHGLPQHCCGLVPFKPGRKRAYIPAALQHECGSCLTQVGSAALAEKTAERYGN